MILINQLKINIDEEINLKNAAAKKLKISENEILDLNIIRRSVDARKKPELFYIYNVTVSVKNEEKLLQRLHDNNISLYKPKAFDIVIPSKKPINRPVIIGFGPAGMFAALILAKAGLNPIVFERGSDIESRTKKVEEFWKSGILDKECNVSFGEGGAGAFSDGKLNTLVNDKTGKNSFVLNTFVKHGADESILYDAKPHVGTDVLFKVVQGIRHEIESLGGQIFFNSRLDDLILDKNNVNNLSGISVNGQSVDCDDLVLAIGHSARDTFYMLRNAGLSMEAKDFAVGFRIEHPQDMISKSLYGDKYKKLSPAPYKLTNNIGDKGIYSFCMCPGGYVVNASSDDNQSVVNGMSYADRGSRNANSAIVVSVGEKEFDKSEPLNGVEYQKKLEKKAFDLADGRIPQQLLGDFKENRPSSAFGNFETEAKGLHDFSNLRDIYSDEINNALIASFDVFERRINGFSRDDAILSGIESRTSSPVRILRDDISFTSNISGIYPCGEGCGYAGGIMSAAYDGIRIAEKIILKYI